MTQEHPITPPPELYKQWWTEGHHQDYCTLSEHIAAQAARWGADQELAACCAIALTDPCCGTKFQRFNLVQHIKQHRRPKPPSLKEQALTTLQRISKDKYPCNFQEDKDWDTIRRALEQLND